MQEAQPNSLQQWREVVVPTRPAPAPRATARALVDDDELATLIEELNRPHRGATGPCPIAGLHIDVQGPEADGAVVRVAITAGLMAAVETGEVFAGALEAPRQKGTSLRRTKRGAPG